MMADFGVFCLEAEWDSDLNNKPSVLPVLELLERLDEIKAIHRDVATCEEARWDLRKYAEAEYDAYRVLYVASHGEKGAIAWSEGNSMSLADLGSVLAEGRSGYYLYLGSCLTLFNNAQAEELLEASGAKAVLGYRSEIEWVESAAFDLILLSWMANHSGHPKTLFRRVMARHEASARRLKFVMATSAGVLRAQDYQSE
jgi:hypothetical protein